MSDRSVIYLLLLFLPPLVPPLPLIRFGQRCVITMPQHPVAEDMRPVLSCDLPIHLSKRFH